MLWKNWVIEKKRNNVLTKNAFLIIFNHHRAQKLCQKDTAVGSDLILVELDHIL